jgi:hypothetical protein
MVGKTRLKIRLKQLITPIILLSLIITSTQTTGIIQIISIILLPSAYLVSKALLFHKDKLELAGQQVRLTIHQYKLKKEQEKKQND